ncbi:putative ribonuclease H-like domain-containing protein [Tanacetum coccineum]
MVPRTVLSRSGSISVNTVRPVNTIQPRTVVNTVKGARVNTARPKAVLSVVNRNKRNAVKASAYYKEIDGGFVTLGGKQSNGNAGTKACDDAGKARVETVPGKDYILLLLWTQDPPFYSVPKNSLSWDSKPSMERKRMMLKIQGVKVEIYLKGKIIRIITMDCADDLNIPDLEEIGRFSNDAEDDGLEADMTNLDTHILVRSAAFQTTEFTRIIQAQKGNPIIKRSRLYKAIQDITSEFKLQQVWTLVDLPHGKRAIGTKWVYKNKKVERGIVIRNKARLVAQGYTQEEGIDYDEVFAHVARIKVIRLFLAYASFKDFVVYQMDFKSDFLYGKIEEEVYVCQPPGFEDPDFPDRVYKVEKALYGLHQAPRAWYETLSTYLLDNGFQRGKIDKTLFIRKDKGELTFFLGLQVMQKEDRIFISQDKYMTEILNKFGFSDVKTASTPIETHKPLLKDADGEDIDEHMYRSMIGSLMYLTSSRPDIMFVVCVCAKFQVNPKVSHLHAVKIIFRNLKGQPILGLWYPKYSPFDLVAYTDSNYARASLDRKSTTGGCQFLECILILWQCKKQTVVANSTTEAEYVVASSCCGQHKHLADGTVSRYKARFVANGSTQLSGIDVDETFSLVFKPATIQTLLSHSGPGTDTAYLLLHVDDIVLTASSEVLLHQIISSLHQEFSMSDLGSLSYFLGISVVHDSSRMLLFQRKYAAEILDRDHMVNCNPSRTPIDTESKLGANGDLIFNLTLYHGLEGAL